MTRGEPSDWQSIRPARSIHELMSGIWARECDRIALTMIPTGNPDDGEHDEQDRKDHRR